MARDLLQALLWLKVLPMQSSAAVEQEPQRLIAVLKGCREAIQGSVILKVDLKILMGWSLTTTAQNRQVDAALAQLLRDGRTNTTGPDDKSHATP